MIELVLRSLHLNFVTMESTFAKQVVMGPFSISCQEQFPKIVDFQPSKAEKTNVQPFQSYCLVFRTPGAAVRVLYKKCSAILSGEWASGWVVGCLLVWHVLLQIVREWKKLILVSDLCHLYFCIQQCSAPFPLTFDAHLQTICAPFGLLFATRL